MIAIILWATLLSPFGGFDPQDRSAFATIVINGREAMGFRLESRPYVPGCGGGVGTKELAGRQTVDDETIASVEFVGWAEGDGYRVVAFAQVEGERGRTPAGECAGSLRPRREIASVRLRAGEQGALEGMKDLGVTPWTIKIVHR